MPSVNKKIVNFIKENVSWRMWKEIPNRQNIMEMAAQESSQQVTQETIEAIWQFYFNSCFPGESLPDNVTSYAIGFNLKYLAFLHALTELEDTIDISDPLLDDEDIIFPLLEHYDNQLQFASPRIRNNKPFALRAVSIDGTAFDFLSDALKADRAIIEAALSCTSCTLSSLPETLLQDRALILIALRGNDNEEVFDLLPAQFLDDREVVLLMVKSSGLFLEKVSLRLREDVEVIDAACQQNPEARQFALSLTISTTGLSFFESKPNTADDSDEPENKRSKKMS